MVGYVMLKTRRFIFISVFYNFFGYWIEFIRTSAFQTKHTAFYKTKQKQDTVLVSALSVVSIRVSETASDEKERFTRE